MTPTLSWLITLGPQPCYTYSWLIQAVQSCFISKDVSSEVVLVLDGKNPNFGSSNSTSEFGEGKEVLPVKLICLPNCVGSAQAHNAGLAHCAGEIIANLDSDDYNLPDRLKLQLPLLEKAQLVGGQLQTDDGNVSSRVIEERTLREFTPICIHGTWLFRKDFMLAMGGWPTEYLCEDLAFSCKLLRKSGIEAFANTTKPVIHYRSHPGSIVHRDPELMRSEARRWLFVAEADKEKRYQKIIHPFNHELC